MKSGSIKLKQTDLNKIKRKLTDLKGTTVTRMCKKRRKSKLPFVSQERRRGDFYLFNKVVFSSTASQCVWSLCSACLCFILYCCWEEGYFIFILFCFILKGTRSNVASLVLTSSFGYRRTRSTTCVSCNAHRIYRLIINYVLKHLALLPFFTFVKFYF